MLHLIAAPATLNQPPLQFVAGFGCELAKTGPSARVWCQALPPPSTIRPAHLGHSQVHERQSPAQLPHGQPPARHVQVLHHDEAATTTRTRQWAVVEHLDRARGRGRCVCALHVRSIEAKQGGKLGRAGTPGNTAIVTWPSPWGYASCWYLQIGMEGVPGQVIYTEVVLGSCHVHHGTPCHADALPYMACSPSASPLNMASSRPRAVLTK